MSNEPVVAADASAVLKADSEHKKAAVLIKSRRTGLSAQLVRTLASSEKTDSVVGLAYGLYLESKKDLKAEEAVKVVATVAKRRGSYGMACAMAAMSPAGLEICRLLVDGGDGKRDAKKLAASILAHYARITTMTPARHPIITAAETGLDGDGQPGGKAKPKPKGKNRKKINARRGGRALTFRANINAVKLLLVDLLEEKDQEILEPALLAAAYLKIEGFVGKSETFFKHRSPQVRAAMLLYLAKTGEALPDVQVTRVFVSPGKVPAIYTRLTPLLSNYDVTTSPYCYGCEAIGVAGDAKFLPQLHKAMMSRDLRVQIEAAKALEKIASPESVPVLVRTIKKCPWPVLVAATGALGAIGSLDAMDPLIKRFEDEKGRMRLDLTYALSSIVGKQYAQTVDVWKDWWATAKSSFTADAKKTAAFRKAHRVQDMQIPRLGFFYHAPVFSDRVVFTLDTSASMKGEKFKDLKENLVQTFESLKKFVKFNVADFGGHVRVMIPNRMASAGQARLLATQKLEYMKLTLGTRTYDGIEAAMALPTMDTIYFLSDGAPVASKLNSWGRIVAGIHLLNRYRPVAVFTIEFKASAGNLAALREMAARFHGRSGATGPEENELN